MTHSSAFQYATTECFDPEPEAADLFFQLVSSRYERASLIVTSDKVFGRWGEVFGMQMPPGGQYFARR